jgi:hypothetical protein
MVAGTALVRQLLITSALTQRRSKMQETHASAMLRGGLVVIGNERQRRIRCWRSTGFWFHHRVVSHFLKTPFLWTRPPFDHITKSIQGGIVREELLRLFRRFVLYAQNSGSDFGELVREKSLMLFRRFLIFLWDVRCDHANSNDVRLRAKLEWPYVMNSSVTMHRPLVSGTWIWLHQHAHWHHRYFRTRA